MKKILLALILVLCSVTPASAAEKPSVEEMLNMLKISGTVDIINQVTTQVIANTEASIRKSDPGLPEEAYAIINEEMTIGMQEWLKTLMAKQLEYYSNHLTRAEVLELTEMYGSAAYKKMLKIGKTYIQTELQPVLQKETPIVTKTILQRIQERLKREGYLDKPEAGA